MGVLEEFQKEVRSAFSRVRKDMENLQEEIDTLRAENARLKAPSQEFDTTSLKTLVKEAVTEALGRPRNSLEKEIERKVARNKKRVIKNKMKSLVLMEQYSALDLKELMVDNLRYCSKASFYRYLNELKDTGTISTVVINDRELLMCHEREKLN